MRLMSRVPKSMYAAVVALCCVFVLVPAYSQDAADDDDAQLTRAIRLLAKYDAANTDTWRRACAIGVVQNLIDDAAKKGTEIDAADVCVAALRWTARDGKLLTVYMDGDHEAGARFYIEASTDDAALKPEPFKATDTPEKMWNHGDLTPSTVFDSAFTRAYLHQEPVPDQPINTVLLKRETEECMSMTTSLATCAAAGKVQGALAYRARNSVGNYQADSSQPEPQKNEGPDRTQATQAINEGFIHWSSGWAMDRYQPGSAQIDTVNCGDQGCQAQGKFTFFRMGAPLRIPFLADFNYAKNDQYYLNRLCYNDTSTGMQDCTE